MRAKPPELPEHEFQPRVVAALDMWARTQGNDFDRMRLAVKAAVEREVCTGCGTDKSQTYYDDLGALTCCPERDMRPLATIR